MHNIIPFFGDFNKIARFPDVEKRAPTFQVTPGATYTAQANGYGSRSIAAWQDGNTNSMDSFVVAPSTTTLTASFVCM